MTYVRKRTSSFKGTFDYKNDEMGSKASSNGERKKTFKFPWSKSVKDEKYDKLTDSTD